MAGAGLDAVDLAALPSPVRARPELLPALHYTLERADRLGVLDGAERERARRAYYTSLARTPRWRDGLAALLDDARAVGATLVPIKGALLAFAAYPEPALRPMADLDVALAAGDLEALGAALARRGYRRFGGGRRRFRLDHAHAVAFLHPSLPTVELHARLWHELGADGSLDALVARARPLALDGVGTALAPSWEDHLVLVAVHAATHALAESATWLLDLAVLAPRVVDGDAVRAEVARRRGRAATHLAFACARRLLPSLTLPEIAPPPGLLLRCNMLARALGPDWIGAARPSQRASLLARAALTDSPLDVARAFAVKARLGLWERLVEGVVGDGEVSRRTG